MQSGKKGGAHFEIFASVCPNTLETAFAPITLETNRNRRTGRIRVPAIAECDVDQSNRRTDLEGYAAWEIHPVMKIAVND